MFYHFLFMTAIACIGLSLSLAPLGCFLIWRRQAFFGDAISHSAILGIALSLMANVAPLWGIITVCVILSALLAYGSLFIKLPSDTWLGLLSYSLIGVGYIVIKSLSMSGKRSGSVEQFLFGDLLLLNFNDIVLILAALGCVILFLGLFWRSIMLITIDEEAATISGISPRHLNFFFLTVLSSVIAVTLPLVGALLVPGLLLIPGACAVQLARSPEGMIIKSACISLFMTFGGIFVGYKMNWPLSPSIIILGFCYFLLIRKFLFLKNYSQKS